MSDSVTALRALGFVVAEPAVPSVVRLDTPGMVRSALQSAARLRRLDPKGISVLSGVPEGSVTSLLEAGRGSLHDLRLVLASLGVRATTLPAPRVMSEDS